MPHAPYWFKHIREITSTFEAYTRPFLCRRDIEIVVQVSQSEAQRLLRRAGGRKLGGALVVERKAFLSWLKAVEDGPDCQAELERRFRLEADLEKNRKVARARAIPIQTGPEVKTLEGLPPTIRLTPGKLEIEYFGTEDLLRQLYELSQAVMSDYLRFQQVCESTSR